MDNTNTDSDSELIGQSKKFNEKINAIATQFLSALDDYKNIMYILIKILK